MLSGELVDLSERYKKLSKYKDPLSPLKRFSVTQKPMCQKKSCFCPRMCSK